MDPQLLTPTAQAFQDLAHAMGSNPASWMHFAIAALVGAVLAPWGQNMVEGFVGKSPNLFVRLLAPTILGSVTSTLIAIVGKQYGIMPQDAALALATFLGAVHAFNGSSLAADVKKVVALAGTPQAQTLETAVLTAAGHPEAALIIGSVQKALATARAAAAPSAPVIDAGPAVPAPVPLPSVDPVVAQVINGGTAFAPVAIPPKVG